MKSFKIFLAVFTVFCLVQKAHSQAPPTGIISWWPAESTANDAVGPNHGTLKYGTTFAPGMVGQAFSFDGVDDYIEIYIAQNIPATGPFSCEAWLKYDASDQPGVNPENLTIGGCCPFCAAGGGIHAIILGADTNVSMGRGCGLDGIGSSFICGFDTNIGDNTWHHVATVWDGTHSHIYIDGILKAQCPGTDYTRPTTRVTMGSRFDDNGSFAVYRGLVDEIAIYNRALCASEIKAIFDAGSAGKSGYIPPIIIKGDLNSDSSFAPADVVLQLNCVFLASGFCDLCIADVNCSGDLTPSDVVLELNKVFLGLADPPWCGD